MDHSLMDAFQSAVRAIPSHYQHIGQEPQYTIDHSAVPASASSAHEELYHERWERTPRPRGRQAKDPHAEHIHFDCKDIDDLETCLSEYLQAPTAPAEHTTVKFHFPITSAFMVYTRDFKRDSSTVWTPANVTDLMKKTAVSVVEVLQPTENAKDQIVRQKAVARTIVEAIQRADGFKYSFHNNWMSREDRAHRFSFFCNDSTLNKGRAANGGVGTEGRIKKKAVYDCKGLIAIKFSITKNNLEVHYKHVPLHKTYDERAPIPRKESKRYRMLEIIDPEITQRWEKRQKTEAQAKEKPPPKKRGRPRKSTSTATPAAAMTQAGTVKDSLQPLLEFLGSAEARTSSSGHGDRNDAESNSVLDGGVVIADDEDAQQPENHDNTESNTPASFPAQKRNELQPNTTKPPKARPKYMGPHVPGTMEGSLDSGNITWSDANQPPASHPPKQTERPKKTKGSKKTGSSDKGKQKDVTDSSLSELELLKQQLAATQERLQKLEADKQAPPAWNYPAYPYYPYPLPPQGYYPPQPPPSGWPDPSAAITPQPTFGYQYHQSPSHSVQNNAPQLYPGGPPHPNAPRPSMPPPSVPANAVALNVNAISPETTTSQANGDAPSKSGDKVKDVAPATVQEKTMHDAGISSSALPGKYQEHQPAIESQPSHTPQASDKHTTPATMLQAPVQPEPPAQNFPHAPGAPSSQIQFPPSLARGEPLKGVLKLVDNDFATRTAHDVSFQVAKNAKTAGPQKGKMRLVSAPLVSISGPAGEAAEDARMKSFFDSALAAIAGPQPNSGPPVAMYSPITGYQSSQYGPAPTSAQPQYQPSPPNWPPYGYYAYPYQQSGHYHPPHPTPQQPGHCPPPPLTPQQPYPPAQLPSYAFVQPPAPTPPPPKPGEQPPPGYEALRAQMVAHAQAAPPPSTPATTSAANVRSPEAESVEDVTPASDAALERSAATTVPSIQGADVDRSSPSGWSSSGSDPTVTAIRAATPQSISSENSD